MREASLELSTKNIPQYKDQTLSPKRLPSIVFRDVEILWKTRHNEVNGPI